MDHPGRNHQLLLVSLCSLLKRSFSIQTSDAQAISLLTDQTLHEICNVVDRVKWMANVSGRTTVNIFDSEPIFARHSPLQLLEFMKTFSGPAGEGSSYHSEIVVPHGSVNILKRPLDYTYKDTVTRAFRPEDPVTVQKSRAEQLHSVESSIRYRAELFGPEEQKFVNFDY